MLNTHILSGRVALLRLMLLVQGGARPYLSEEFWQEYSVFDYPSVKDYCLVCLLNGNAATSDSPNPSLCYLPVIAPRGHGVNLNALLAAQKVLLDSDNLDFPTGDDDHERAAQKLIEVMRTHDVKPQPALLKLAKLEENEA